MTSDEMRAAGYGTGHPLDMGKVQVTIEDTVHNVLRRYDSTVASLPSPFASFGVPPGIPVALTMCGLQIPPEHEPHDRGPTRCRQCSTLAAHDVMSLAVGR